MSKYNRRMPDISSTLVASYTAHLESEELKLESEYHLVPVDFPCESTAGAVSGAQVKIPLVEFKGRFYQPGTSPPERYVRWDVCEDLAQQFCLKCRETKSGKRAHMQVVEILDQYLQR